MIRIQFSKICSYRFVPNLLLSLGLLSITGCSTMFGWLPKTEGCNIRTFINLRLQDYLKSRYDSSQLVRMAVVPFDVQETFAPPGTESLHFGRQLARLMVQQFHATGEVRIVELFNQDRWPGKREEFFTGNHRAMQLAADAGYDMVLVGYMEELRDDQSLNVYTKIIDTANGVTIWSGVTNAYSQQRLLDRTLSKVRVAAERPSMFLFPERAEEFANCTVHAILTEKPVP